MREGQIRPSLIYLALSFPISVPVFNYQALLNQAKS